MTAATPNVCPLCTILHLPQSGLMDLPVNGMTSDFPGFALHCIHTAVYGKGVLGRRSRIKRSCSVCRDIDRQGDGAYTVRTRQTAVHTRDTFLTGMPTVKAIAASPRSRATVSAGPPLDYCFMEISSLKSKCTVSVCDRDMQRHKFIH